MHNPQGRPSFAKAPLRHVRQRRARGTVSFDLDDTLIVSPFPAVLREVSAAIAPDRADAVRAEVVARHRRLLAAGDVAAFDWAGIIDRLAADHGTTMEADLDALVAARSHDTARLLDPELPVLLAGLRDAGWRVIVVTNGYRRFQVPPIEALGLAAVLDALVTSDDVGAAKPDPRIFAAAYDGSPGPHVHVGDIVEQDIAGAHRAGVASVLVGSAVPGRDGPRPTAAAPTIRAAIGLLDEVVRPTSAGPRA